MSGATEALTLGGQGKYADSSISFSYELRSFVPPAARLALRAICAYNLPVGTDSKSSKGNKKSDPFICFQLLECGDLIEFAKTTSKFNDPNPKWREELSLELPRGSPRPPLLQVYLWDDDLTNEDDPLATTDVRLEPSDAKAATAGGMVEVALVGVGKKNKNVKVSFEWERIDDVES